MLRQKFNSFIYRLTALLRVFFLNFSKRVRIRFSLKTMFAPSSTIVSEGRLTIEKGFALLKNATLICRKDGCVKIGSNVSIGTGTYIVSHLSIEIGDNCQIAQGVKIYDHDHDFKTISDDPLYWADHFCSGSISIGNNVWIGANVIILRGTVIGDNCIIGAGSVLKGKYPSNSIIVQKRTDTIIER